MRLGLGSYACAWALGEARAGAAPAMDATSLVERAASLGVHVVQIADNVKLEAMGKGELDRIGHAAREWGVTIELGMRGIEAHRMRFFLELCRRFECRLLRVATDTTDQQPGPRAIVASIRAMTGAFEDADVVLAIENHDRFTAETLASIVREIDHEAVGVCLDTVNSFGALEGPEVVVRTLAPFVVNLHLKDFTIERVPNMMGFQIGGAPAGQGRLNIPWLLNELRQAGRDPNAILELWPPPEENWAATVKKEEEWGRASVTYLRTWIAS